MIKITVNSENIMVESQSIWDFITKGKKLNPDHVVIEYNLSILNKKLWPQTMLKESDNLEIVSFVGGG
jgi:sulfur carrier protein